MTSGRPEREESSPRALAGVDGGGVLELLAEQPGGAQLLGIARERVHLVGGSVRDLIRGAPPRELDVVVEGDIEPLLSALGGEPVVHERFQTASVQLPGARIDLTRSRRERYRSPGALPEVQPAPLAEDLLRRDLTVNAIAVALGGPDRGRVQTAPGALEDLAAGRLRVLHDRSFIDDPTRLWRLGRYAARLGFAVEPHTASLARHAVDDGALRSVTLARIGAELRLALAENEPLPCLQRLAELGVLRGLGLGEALGEPAISNALELLPPDGRRDLLLLAALLMPAPCAETASIATGSAEGARELLEGLEFTAADRDRALAALAGAQRLARSLPECRCASQLQAAVAGVPPEGVALAGALAADPAAAAAAARWLAELRHVHLQIDGHDLLAAGIAEGPEIGRRLRATLARRLDGELAAGREAELQAALEES